MKYTEFNCEEIFKLKEMLEKENIPFEFVTEQKNMGFQLCYPSKSFEERECSVIEKHGSYGIESDKLEIMGLLTNEELKHDSVCGWLTAGNVFDRIKKHYESEEK